MSTDFTSVSTTETVAPVGAPSWPAYTAAACALLALAAILPGTDHLTAAGAGYALGALVVPAFTVAYRFARRAAARNPFFIPNRSMERFILTMLVVGILAGAINAWFVAAELAKQ